MVGKNSFLLDPEIIRLFQLHRFDQFPGLVLIKNIFRFRRRQGLGILAQDKLQALSGLYRVIN